MRVAVRRSGSSEPTILTFAIQDDDRFQLSCSGPPIPEDVLQNALRAAGATLPAKGSAFEEASAKASQPDGARDTSKPVSDVELQGFVDKFHESLVEHGWDSEALPDADFSFTLEIDARTGRALGKYNPLHPYVSAEAAGLSGNIWTRLQSVINKGDDVAERMNDAVDRSDHVAAVQALESNEGKLAIAIGRHGRMLDAALRIDRSQLDAGFLNSVLRFIVSVGTASGRFRDAEPAARELLQSDHTLSEEARFGIRNVLAIAAFKRGAREAAISTWQDLLRDRQKIDPGERGWIERNMAAALLDKGTQAERLQAERALKRSADSFQQAGDKAEAARSLGQLVRVYQHTDAQAALAQYDEVLALMDRDNLLDATARASVLHSKAQRLLEIGQADQAAYLAREAVDLCRSVHGAEMELIASLHLVAIAAEQAGDVDAAQSARSEAREGQEQLKSRYFDFARRAMALLETFDAEEADALDAEARASGTPEHIAMIEVIRVIRDEHFSHIEKMERLEVHIAAMQAHGIDPKLLQPARIAVAVLLTEEKEYERAAQWWRKVLEVQPLDARANQALIAVLWEAEVWGEAAIAIKEQLDRFGEAPNRLYAYGRSLFEAGDMDGAVRALTRSMTLAGEDQDLCIRARELRDRAFELGGSVTPPEAPAPVYGPVTLDEVRIALADFGAFVSSSKRMAFWRRPRGTNDHEWIPRPERFGQDLLHTFVKARFHERVMAFEEISVGAGRLDLLLLFAGGLAIVIELKMCGAGYSTTYASSGGEQVRHYLTNTTSHIGFVVVFDARKRHNAQPLGAAGTGTHTVEEVLIDVHPTVDP